MFLRSMERIPRRFLVEYAISISVFCACGGTIIIKLMEYYGFSLAVSNFLLALPSAMLPMQLVGGFLYEKSRGKHSFLRLSGGTWRLLQGLVFLTVLLPSRIGAAAMLVCYLCMVGFHQFSNAAHSAWLVNASEGKVRSDYFSLRELLLVVFYVVLSMSFGAMLNGRAAQPGAAFVAIGLIVLLAIACDSFFFLRLPPPVVQSGPPIRLAHMLEPFQNKGFRSALLFHAAWHISNMFIANFAGVYQIQVLGLDTVYLITWSVVANIVKIFGIPIFAKVAQYIGWKLLTMLTVVGTVGVGVLWMLVTPENCVWFYPIVAILGILPGCGLGVGFFKFLICNCAMEKRNTFFGVNAAVAGLCATVGATLCSLLADFLQRSFAQPPYWIIFLLGAIGTGICALLVARTPYEER